MVDLMMWLVIAALMLATAIQSIGYYQQASFTYQAKSDLAGEHSWAAARTSLDTKAPTSTEMTAALLSGDLKLTNNGGVYNIGVIATTGDKYCLGVKAPSVKGNNVFYSTSDTPNNVMSDVALPAFCGTATEVTTTGTATPEASASASPSATASAPTWTTTPISASSKYLFFDLATSDDGTKLVGGSNAPTSGPAEGAGVRVSADGGTTWTHTASNQSTNATYDVISSADGKVLLYSASGSFPQVSTNSGATWTNVGGGAFMNVWPSSVTPDGKYSAFFDGTFGHNYLWLSTDSGVTYNANTSAFGGAGLWISGNGSRMLSSTTGASGALYISTNAGTSWTKNTALSAITSGSFYSASGNVGTSTIMAAKDGGSVYVSNDTGVTWTTQTALGTGSWKNVAASPDGTKLVVAKDGGSLYTSKDSGATWTEQLGAGSGTWKSVRITIDNSGVTAIRDTTVVKVASF